MVEELKAEMRKLENLIGFEGKVDVTSRAFTQELIRALDSKYKDDVKNSLRLHQLEFYHDLIESARHKQRKNTEVEEKFLLEEKKDDDDDDEEEVEEQVKEKELFKKPEEVVAIKAENVDEWKDLMTLSRIYYVLEHPNSTGLTWKRRISKKKSISKFSDKDLIEWRVAENFKLRGLEEWALSRSEARKVAEKSPYDFDDLLEDDESRELEDMFNILGTQKQKKRKVGQLEKSLKSNRPFKFKDEGVEDWTESYSDDSEESGMEDMAEEILQIDEEPDFKVDDYKVSSEEQSINEEEIISEIFSVYEEKPKFRSPVFEEMDKAETMERWFDLCHEAVGVPAVTTPERPPAPQILFTIEEGEDEEYLETEIPDDIGYVRGQKITVEEAKEKDFERPGGRIPVKEVQEKDIEKPGDDSEEPPILAPYTGEGMHIKEAEEKDIERPGGRIPVKEAKEKDIEKLAGRVPEPDAKDSEEDTGKPPKAAKVMDVKKLPEKIPVKEAKEKDIERPGGRIPVKEGQEKDIEKPGDDSEEPPILAPYKGERMHIKEAEEKDIERPGGRIPVKEAKEKDIEKLAGRVPEPNAKDVDLGKTELDSEEDTGIPQKAAKDKNVEKLPEKIPVKEAKEKDIEPNVDFDEEPSTESIDKLFDDMEALDEDLETSNAEESARMNHSAYDHAPLKLFERKPSIEHEKSSAHSPDMDQLKSKDLSKEQVTSSEKGSISKHDEEVIDEQIKKIAKEGKDYALSDAKNEAVHTIPGKVSSTSSERQATKVRTTSSSEKQASKEQFATPSETQATKMKSLTSPEKPSTEKKSELSSEKQATKKKSATSSETQATKKKSLTTPKMPATKKKSLTSPEKSLAKKKSSTSSETQATKEKTETQATKKKSLTTPKIPATKTKSAMSSERPATKKKSATSSQKLATGKKSPTPSERQSTKQDISKEPSSYETEDLESLLRKESNISNFESGPSERKEKSESSKPKINQEVAEEGIRRMLKEAQSSKLLQDSKPEKSISSSKSVKKPQKEGESKSDLGTLLRSESGIGSDSLGESDLDDTYGRKASKKPSTHQATISMQDEQRVGERLKSIIVEGKVDAVEEKEKEYKKRRATLSPDDFDVQGADLESILKSESSLNVAKSSNVEGEESLLRSVSSIASDSLGEFDLDDMYGRKASKKPSTHQATIGMQDEQRVGERLKSIIEEGKVDALEEKEKEYKKRRATLSPDDFDAQDSDLESILKSESSLNVTKSGNVKGGKSPQVGKTVAEAGTVGLGQEDKVEKVVKSAVKEAKPTALRRQDSGSSERTKKGSRSSFRKSR